MGLFLFQVCLAKVISWENVHMFCVYIIIHLCVCVYHKIILHSNFIHKFEGLIEYSYYLNNFFELGKINNIIMLIFPHMNRDMIF